MYFCKTQIEERSENAIENIYQSKRDNSINAVTKHKEGGCFFLKSRLPTARYMLESSMVNFQYGCSLLVSK